VKKANTPALKTFVLGLYAGAYIAFGGFLSMTVVNACPGDYTTIMLITVTIMQA
jgi:formate/nitrite transporter FocA (FNT family)